jgi:hypothetical protein
VTFWLKIFHVFDKKCASIYWHLSWIHCLLACLSQGLSQVAKPRLRKLLHIQQSTSFQPYRRTWEVLQDLKVWSQG